MTNLSRRTLLRAVTLLTAAAALPRSGIMTSFTAWAQTAPGKLEDSVRALFFDVFGTMVDWRTGVAREAQAILKPLGFALDWLAFADAWRAEYQPGMGAFAFRSWRYQAGRNLKREGKNERVIYTIA